MVETIPIPIPHKSKCKATQKIIYETEEEIIKAKKLQKKSNLRHYQCPSCKKWHFTRLMKAKFLRRKIIKKAAKKFSKLNKEQ